MRDIIIREACPEDTNGIAAVTASALATLRETYRPNQRALANQKEITDTLTQLVAVLNDRVVGSVQYSLVSDRVHFVSLHVHADYRRQGVARQLVQELTEIGKCAGAKKLTAYTVTQTGNSAIFARLGFREISEEPSELFESDQFDSITETYLECPIASS